MATFKNTPYLRVVSTKSFSAIGNAISGVPTGPSIGRLLPQSGVLTQYGKIMTVVINGNSSGAICSVGTGGSSNDKQGHVYIYTDKLQVYSGDAAQFGYLPANGSGFTVGHGNIALIQHLAVQNRQVGFFMTQSGPVSFTLPRAGE